MAYTIYINGNTVLTTIENGEVDSISTSLDLVGKNVNNYGEYFNNNLVKLLTNSADTAPPRSQQVGQFWYDTSENRLKIYDGIEFSPIVGSTVDAIEPLTNSKGDLWYDSDQQQLKVWYNNEFHLIGPAISPNLGSFGINPPSFPIIGEDSNEPKTVGVISAYGKYFGVVSTSSWTMENSTATAIFGVTAGFPVKEGLTIFKDLEVGRTIYKQGIPLEDYPVKHLSSYCVTTRFGSIATASTVTNRARYEAANRHISDVLYKLFPITSVSTSSEAKVVCDYEQMIAVTTITNEVFTGTTTISLSTSSGIQVGNLVYGNTFIPNGTTVIAIDNDAVELSNPIFGVINTGSTVSFNTSTTSIRHFRLDKVDVDSWQWYPKEIYTTSILNTVGELSVIDSTSSSITVVGTQTSFYSGLQIEFINGVEQTTGYTIIKDVIVDLINSKTNIDLQTESSGSTGTVIFNAHPVPFVSTYTNIVI